MKTKKRILNTQAHLNSTIIHSVSQTKLIWKISQNFVITDNNRIRKVHVLQIERHTHIHIQWSSHNSEDSKYPYCYSSNYIVDSIHKFCRFDIQSRRRKAINLSLFLSFEFFFLWAGEWEKMYVYAVFIWLYCYLRHIIIIVAVVVAAVILFNFWKQNKPNRNWNSSVFEMYSSFVLPFCYVFIKTRTKNAFSCKLLVYCTVFNTTQYKRCV